MDIIMLWTNRIIEGMLGLATIIYIGKWLWQEVIRGD